MAVGAHDNVIRGQGGGRIVDTLGDRAARQLPLVEFRANAIMAQMGAGLPGCRGLISLFGGQPYIWDPNGTPRRITAELLLLSL